MPRLLRGLCLSDKYGIDNKSLSWFTSSAGEKKKMKINVVVILRDPLLLPFMFCSVWKTMEEC